VVCVHNRSRTRESRTLEPLPRPAEILRSNLAAHSVQHAQTLSPFWRHELGLLLVGARARKRPAAHFRSGTRLATSSECRSHVLVLEEGQLLTLGPTFGDTLELMLENGDQSFRDSFRWVYFSPGVARMKKKHAASMQVVGASREIPLDTVLGPEASRASVPKF
jgi:hypothetical protein